MSQAVNPFPNDPNRYAIWEVLVARDVEAFVTQDWGKVACDFIEEDFWTLDAHFLAHPDSWQLSFPTLASDHEVWLEQVRANTCRGVVETQLLSDILVEVKMWAAQ